jgi:muramoyltetrapeptide carboxypeptidase
VEERLEKTHYQNVRTATSLRIPVRLRLGDTVGILSTSSPVSAEMVENTRRYFEERGYLVQEGAHILDQHGFMAGTAEARASDFNDMLADPGIRMIVTATGGASAAQMLPLIHYGTLSVDPKIICGLSDPSILLNALSARSGVPTFHGPNGFNFGNEGPTQYTEDGFWPLVTGDLQFPYHFPVADHMLVLRSGPVVDGWIWGGNMSTIQALIGTPWLPRWAGGILFLEEFQIDYTRTDAMLAHFRHAGIFDRIRALVIGRPAEIGEPDAETYEEIILRNCAGFSFPIVANVPLGHTPDKITLPIGGKVRLDTGSFDFQLLEPAVV